VGVDLKDHQFNLLVINEGLVNENNIAKKQLNASKRNSSRGQR